MTFGEKVKKARKEQGLTQTQLGEKIGVSRRTITSYEADAFPPRTRELYCKLAQVLQVNVNYLLTQEDEFVLEAEEKYGRRGRKGAEALVGELTGLFSGGELAEEDYIEGQNPSHRRGKGNGNNAQPSYIVKKHIQADGKHQSRKHGGLAPKAFVSSAAVNLPLNFSFSQAGSQVNENKGAAKQQDNTVVFQ